MSKKIKILLFMLPPILLLTVIVVTFYFLSATKEQKESNIEQEEYYEASKLTFKNEGELETTENGDDNKNGDIKEDEDKNDIYNRISDINIDRAQIIGDLIYFYSKDEKIYGRINILNGKNQTEILLNDLPVLSETRLSPSQNKLLYRDFNKKSYYVYDFNSEEKIELNKDIETALWHPLDENKIIGTYSSSNKNNINIYKIGSNEREELINLFVNNGFLLDVARDGKNLLYTRAESKSGYEEITDAETEVEASITRHLILFDLNNKKNVWQREDIDKGKFAPDNKRILISKPSLGPYPVLAILDLETSKESTLNLGTYLNKVEFIDQSNLVYAKIEGLKDNFFQDTLWKYNIDTGRHSQLTKLENNAVYDISNIMSSTDGKKIYFVNHYDKKIYVVDTNK